MKNLNAATAVVAPPVVFIESTDAEALLAWAATQHFNLTVQAVDDWATPPAPSAADQKVVHIFAQTQRDAATWNNAKALCLALTQKGYEPALVELSFGLDFILGPTTTWESLTAGAVAKPSGRAPKKVQKAAKRSRSGPVCNTSAAITTCRVEVDDFQQDEMVLPWAAWEVQSSQMGPRATIDLEVVFMTEEGERHTVSVPGIEAVTLDRFEWMEHSPVTRKLPRPAMSDRNDVANAIRDAVGPQGEPTLSRAGRTAMGWIDVDGRAVYVKSDAGLGALGIDPSVFGGEGHAASPYWWGRERTLEEERESLRHVLVTMTGLMNNDAAWWALLSQHARAITPTASRCPILLHGVTNSGKSAVAQAAASLSSEGLTDGELANFNATKVAVEKIASVFENGVVLIDDIPPMTDVSTIARLTDSVDELFRVAHPEGSMKDRGTVGAGGVGLAERMEVHPTALLTTEESVLQLVPKASARNRALMIEIERGVQFASAEDAADFEALAQAHGPTAGYAVGRWLAGEIDKAGGLDAYRARLKEDLKTMTAAIKESHPDWIDRTHKVCAGFLFGLRQILSAALSIGAIDEAMHAELEKRGSTALDVLFKTHVEKWLSSADANEILSRIRVQIRAMRARIGEVCPHGVAVIGGTTCSERCRELPIIGKPIGEGTEVEVALSPDDIAPLISTTHRIWTKDQVKTLLTQIDGAEVRRLRLAGSRIYAVVIPWKEWDGTDSPEAAGSEATEAAEASVKAQKAVLDLVKEEDAA